MRVNSSMTKSIISLSEEDSIREAFDLMMNVNCRHLPVLKEGKLVGLISDRDILLYTSVVAGKIMVEDFPARKIMSKNLITIGPFAQIGDVIDKFLEYKIDCLPVTNSEDELIGIITTTDLLILLKIEDESFNRKPLPFGWKISNLEDYRAFNL